MPQLRYHLLGRHGVQHRLHVLEAGVGPGEPVGVIRPRCEAHLVGPMPQRQQPALHPAQEDVPAGQPGMGKISEILLFTKY